MRSRISMAAACASSTLLFAIFANTLAPSAGFALLGPSKLLRVDGNFQLQGSLAQRRKLALGACSRSLRIDPLMELGREVQQSTQESSGLWTSASAISRRRALQFSAGSVLAAAAPAASPAKPVIAEGSIYKLANGGGDFPLVSFGLQVYDDEKARKLTLFALEAGVRNFFSSVLAGNQRGFAQAVKESGISREELYICGSVVSNRANGFEAAYKATTRGWQQNMKEFSAGNIEYLDQIMLDYPGRDKSSILGQWKSFQEMKDKGLTKSLSVSNFSPEQLDFIINDEATTTKPCVNQLPFNLAYHPGGAKATAQWNLDRGVLVQAWAPLGASTGGFSKRIRTTCAQIGEKYGKSGPQVALRWIVDSGASFTTSASSKKHFEDDLSLFDFKLSPEDLRTLDALSAD